MSGHSKWKTIKRQKGTTDAKRAQAFTKLSNAITVAVKEGGGGSDMSSNFKLRLAVDKARAASMPKDNIQRAIDRGMGVGEKVIFVEAFYEGFGPGGTAVIVEAATDNKARTIQEIKNVFDRNGATLGNPGSVSYQFEQKGMITVGKNGKSYDDIFFIAAEAGAEDVEDLDHEVIIYTKPEDLKKVKDALEAQGLIITDAELIRKPMNVITISDQVVAQRVVQFIEKLEDLGDVQKVFSNFDIPEDILQMMS